MRVRIRTENGYLEINLDKFLMEPKCKAKKMFQLMNRGLTQKEKQEVLEYLKHRQSKEKADTCRKVVLDLKQRILKLQDEEKELRKALDRANIEMREEARVQKSLPEWIREVGKMVDE